MPAFNFISEEQHLADMAALRAELQQEFRSLLRAHLPAEEEYVRTDTAPSRLEGSLHARHVRPRLGARFEGRGQNYLQKGGYYLLVPPLILH
jgi:hypothetical protein